MQPYVSYSKSPALNNIFITTSHIWQTINGLKTATPKVVWKDSTASRCCSLWAPEIHFVDGSWYMYVRIHFLELQCLMLYVLPSDFNSYYSAGTASTSDNQRLHVLKGSSSNIWDSTWSFACMFPLSFHDLRYKMNWALLTLDE